MRARSRVGSLCPRVAYCGNRPLALVLAIELSKPRHDLTGQLVHELKAARIHAFRQRPHMHARAGQRAFESKGNGLCHEGQSSTCTSDTRTSTTRGYTELAPTRFRNFWAD